MYSRKTQERHCPVLNIEVSLAILYEADHSFLASTRHSSKAFPHFIGRAVVFEAGILAFASTHSRHIRTIVQLHVEILVLAALVVDIYG